MNPSQALQEHEDEELYARTVAFIEEFFGNGDLSEGGDGSGAGLGGLIFGGDMGFEVGGIDLEASLDGLDGLEALDSSLDLALDRSLDPGLEDIGGLGEESGDDPSWQDEPWGERSIPDSPLGSLWPKGFANS